MKNKLGLLVAGIAIIVVAAIMLSGKSNGALGDGVEVVAFTSEGKQFGKGSIKVPYVLDDSGFYINVSIDLNGDGKFSGEEWMVNNFSSKAKKDWSSRFYFSTPELNGNKKVVVVKSKDKIADWNGSIPKGAESKVVQIDVKLESVDGQFNMSNVTKPDEAMKGGLGLALAQTQPKTDTPDIQMRTDECAPTGAANSLIRLAGEHGAIDKIPKDPYQLIDDLKRDMGWTYENGVLPDDFVRGKNLWAGRNGLPIKTELVGDRAGESTVEALQEAINRGAAAEVRLRFTRINESKTIGGHLVTVTDVRMVDGHLFMDIHDPASPQGTDTIELINNQVMDYSRWPGDTYLGFGFTQTWEGTPTGTSLDPMTDQELQGIKDFAGEKQIIKVITYNGKKIPLSEVHVGEGEECDKEKHYHANRGGAARAVDGTMVADPGGCGYGKVKSTPSEDYEIRFDFKIQ